MLRVGIITDLDTVMRKKKFIHKLHAKTKKKIHFSEIHFKRHIYEYTTIQYNLYLYQDLSFTVNMLMEISELTFGN